MVSDPIFRIISGGQKGADRAALDAAIFHGLDYGGWCPKGGWAEDMPDPPGVLARYPKLRETPDAKPEQRTEWNVRDSDATLVFLPAGARSPGTDFTIACAKRMNKPQLAADPLAPGAEATIRAWLATNPQIRTLNIAGPRESESPGIYAGARKLLDALIK
jgi:hypothetical protein